MLKYSFVVKQADSDELFAEPVREFTCEFVVNKKLTERGVAKLRDSIHDKYDYITSISYPEVTEVK